MKLKKGEIMNVPKYEKPYDRYKCASCSYDCGIMSSRVCTRCDCEKVGFNYDIICIILQIGIPILSWILYGAGIALLASIFIAFFLLGFETLFLTKIFYNLEKNRKRRYDVKFKKITEHNKQVERLKSGISPEYEEFENSIKNFTSILQKNNDFLANTPSSTTDEDLRQAELRVCKKFNAFLVNYTSLNSCISVENFEDSSIQTFYNVYIASLVENSNKYIIFKQAGRIDQNSMVEFGNLLEGFSKKSLDLVSYVQRKELESFSNKLKDLNLKLRPKN